MNPFDILKSINNNKPIDIEEKTYPAFLVNRGLSYFPDTVLYANEINSRHHLESKLQYDFYINSVRKRNRFSKWHKQTSNTELEAVKQYFGYSEEKAQQALSILTDTQTKVIVDKVNRHGKQ